jgi:hypothetical protein
VHSIARRRRRPETRAESGISGSAERTEGERRRTNRDTIAEEAGRAAEHDRKSDTDRRQDVDGTPVEVTLVDDARDDDQEAEDRRHDRRRDCDLARAQAVDRESDDRERRQSDREVQEDERAAQPARDPRPAHVVELLGRDPRVGDEDRDGHDQPRQPQQGRRHREGEAAHARSTFCASSPEGPPTSSSPLRTRSTRSSTNLRLEGRSLTILLIVFSRSDPSTTSCHSQLAADRGVEHLRQAHSREPVASTRAGVSVLD